MVSDWLLSGSPPHQLPAKSETQFLQQKIDGTLETVTLREVKEDLEIRQNQMETA